MDKKKNIIGAIIILVIFIVCWFLYFRPNPVLTYSVNPNNNQSAYDWQMKHAPQNEDLKKALQPNSGSIQDEVNFYDKVNVE